MYSRNQVKFRPDGMKHDEIQPVAEVAGERRSIIGVRYKQHRKAYVHTPKNAMKTAILVRENCK